MKNGFLILTGAILAGILAFFLSRSQPSADTNAVLLDSMPELTWLRTDLKLSDEQYAKVEQLHREYRPVCADMCRRIAESNDTVARLASNEGRMSDDLVKAIENHGIVMAECKRSMLEHLYQTASLMDQRQSQRYLEISLPLALDSVNSRSETHNHE